MRNKENRNRKRWGEKVKTISRFYWLCVSPFFFIQRELKSKLSQETDWRDSDAHLLK